MKEQTFCPICRRTDFDVLHKVVLFDNYRMPESGVRKSNSYHRNYILFRKILKGNVDKIDITFVVCKECGFIFFSPRPDEEDLSIKYKIVEEQGDTYKREHLGRLVDLRDVRAERIRSLLKPFLTNRTGRALDVGGADGHCLGRFTEEYDCNLLDFETRNLWPGINRLGETLDVLQLSDLFDVVLTLHTLEHVPDPDSFIRKIVGHLSREGILYVEVPYGCAGEIYKTDNFITHINFFSEGSLGTLLEQSGLHIEYIASRPVLSSKRFLPVINAVARKTDFAYRDRHFVGEGYSITRKQMKRGLDLDVTLANIFLVLSRPGEYAKALIGKFSMERAET